LNWPITFSMADLTEQDLTDRGVGKFIAARDYGYDIKKRTYREQEVWTAFTRLRSYYRVECTDDTGYIDHRLATRIAEKRIDTYLLRKSKGEPISLPEPPGVKEEKERAAKAEDAFLRDRSEFGEDVEIDPIRDLTWIYNNIAIRDVKPADAPSAGAYAHLKFIQNSNDNKVDFFTKVYPRIIPSKSQVENLTKFNDDGRANLDLLDRILDQSEEAAEPVSVL